MQPLSEWAQRFLDQDHRLILIEASPLQKTSLLLVLALFLAGERQFLIFGIGIAILLILSFLKRISIVWVIIFLLAFGIGCIRFTPPQALKALPLGKTLHFQAIVIRPPLHLKGFSRMDVDITKIISSKKDLRIRARLYAPFALWPHPGDVVEVFAKLKRPQGYLNPFGYDREKAMASYGIYSVGWITKPNNLRVLAHKNNFYLQTVREKLFRFAETLPGASRGLFEALILGEKSSIPIEIRQRFQRLGISHFLAVSGLHLAILSALAFFLTRIFVKIFPNLLFVMPFKIWWLLGATFISGIYVLLSGPSPSALRAFVMLIVFLLSHLLYREAKILDILSLAVLIILIFWPQAIGTLSFRLSVIAVFGLIIAARLKKRLSFWPKKRIFSYLADIAYYSLVATFFTCPIILLSFGEVSILAPITNIVALPLFTFVILPMEFLAGFLVFVSKKLAFYFALFPGKFISYLPETEGFNFKPPFPIGAFLLGWLPLASLFFIKQRSAKYLFVLLTIVIEIGFWCLYRNLNLITVFDVGQGAAAFAKVYDKYFLFDAGPKRGSFDTGYFIVAPTLKKLGVKRLDSIIISHPQADHAGGLKSLSKEVPVRKILMGSYQGDGLYQELKSYFGAKICMIERPQLLSFPKVRLILLPGKPKTPLSKANRESLVARLCYKSLYLCILFPGDIDSLREKRLLKTKVPISSQILILPHHGSQTSSSKNFLCAVHPLIAISSSRYYKHPHPKTLRRLAKLGIPHLGTKTSGAISLILQNDHIWVCTEKARRKKNLFFRALWPYIPVGCKPLHTFDFFKKN